MDARRRQLIKDAASRPAPISYRLPIGFLALVLPLIAIYGFATNNSELSWPAIICGLAAMAVTVFKFQVNRRL
ncbi:MAG: hypothetical protein ABR549_09610 [Mycobacteriales bacterium]